MEAKEAVQKNVNYTMIPPDGGWGWMIVLAYAIANIIVIPILQSFGLIFKEKFTDMNMTAIDVSIIINVNLAIGMASGLMNGVLFKSFGYRKIGIAAGVFFSFGFFLSSWANSFTYFLITYSILLSIGNGLSTSSFHIALNTYFKKRRNKAAGIAMTITALGPIFVPQIVTIFLNTYGTRGCVLILSAISMHIICAALLLQPIKWHSKKLFIDEQQLQDKNSLIIPMQTTETSDDKMIENQLKKNNMGSQKITIKDEDDSQTRVGSENQKLIQRTNEKREAGSLEAIHLRNSENISDEESKKTICPADEILREEERFIEKIKNSNNNLSQMGKSVTILNEITNSHQKPESNVCRKTLKQIAEIFDLDLLKDKIFVNIMFGLSIAIFAEINFSLLTPFFFYDLNYTTEQIALIMSVIAISDLIFRFLSPFIGDYFKQTARVMYMYSLLMLIITRTTLIFATNYVQMLIIAVGLGIAKGVRTVYMNLVIPHHVPIERLASASGMQMVTNGIFFISLGPLIGVIRDITGTYNNCIFFLNFVTSITLVVWTTEMIYFRIKNQSKTN